MKELRIITVSLCILFFVSGLTFSWQKQAKILSDENIISLFKTCDDQSIIYAASKNSIYRTKDNGNYWHKIYNISKANKKINRLYSDLNFSDIIYVATQEGLYQSRNQGEDWQRIFIGSSDLENNCLSMAKSNKEIYLGTTQGLFISYDEGKNWHKSFEQFLDRVISSIIINPQDEDIAYIACEKGVFISEDRGKTWQRIYVVYSSEIPSEDYNDYDGEISDQIINIKSMVISHREPNRLYIATTKGIFFTDNRGKEWRKLTNFGLSSLNIRSMVISKVKDQLFVATDKGVFRLNGEHWDKIGNGLTYEDFNALSIDEDHWIWIAGKGGVFKVRIGEIDKSKNTNQANERKTSEFDIENLFKGEPTIEEVQKAAIEYSETNLNKIKSWRNQARLKALFPTFSVGYDKNVYGSSSGAMAIGPRDWDMSLSWSVGDLIWSSDQTSIDTRSRLTVQLRQDILDQVTHLYYERKRLRAEFLMAPPKDEKEKLYKILELEEVTANLDGLTKGYFSKAIQNIDNNP